MAPKFRRTSLLDRSAGVKRDARLVVIATEDSLGGGASYFRILQDNGLIDRTRVRLVVRPSVDGRSAPADLIASLDAHRKDIDTALDTDEYWVVFDVDHHRDAELASAFSLAKGKGYSLAGSNPCFELWLLFHETEDVSQVVTQRERPSASQECTKLLREILGQYSKSGLPPERYTLESVRTASERARRNDSGPDQPWPQVVGTHVYRVIEAVLAPATMA